MAVPRTDHARCQGCSGARRLQSDKGEYMYRRDKKNFIISREVYYSRNDEVFFDRACKCYKYSEKLQTTYLEGGVPFLRAEALQILIGSSFKTKFSIHIC